MTKKELREAEAVMQKVAEDILKVKPVLESEEDEE